MTLSSSIVASSPWDDPIGFVTRILLIANLVGVAVGGVFLLRPSPPHRFWIRLFLGVHVAAILVCVLAAFRSARDVLATPSLGVVLVSFALLAALGLAGWWHLNSLANGTRLSLFPGEPPEKETRGA